MSHWYSDYGGYGRGFGYTADADVIDRAVAENCRVDALQDVGQPAITLDDLKAHMQYDAPCEGSATQLAEADARVAQALAAAINQAELYTGRSLQVRDWELVRDRFPAHWTARIQLLKPPIICVTEVRYRDCGADTIMPEAEWRHPPRADAICPEFNCHWPCMIPDHDAVRIRYRSGYDATTVPQGLKNAVLVMAATFYENVEDLAPVQLHQIPRSAEMMMIPYKCQEII